MKPVSIYGYQTLSAENEKLLKIVFKIKIKTTRTSIILGEEFETIFYLRMSRNRPENRKSVRLALKISLNNAKKNHITVITFCCYVRLES